jgi:hypothetical protein
MLEGLILMPNMVLSGVASTRRQEGGPSGRCRDRLPVGRPIQREGISPIECDECPVAGADAVAIGVFFCRCHSRGCAAGRIHRGDGQCERAGSFGPLRLTDGKKEATRRYRFSLLGNVLLDRGFAPWKLGGRKESDRCPEERADAGCYAHRQGTPERDSQGASKDSRSARPGGQCSEDYQKQ